MTATTSHNQTTASSAQIQSAPEQEEGQIPHVRVLVVEDHEDTRFLLRTILEMRGVSVVEAENGEMAIALAENLRLDLILMDTNLPLLDGYTATRRLRANSSTSEVPIVIISGHAQPTAEAKAFAAGCSDYLIKPFALREISLVLERYLSPAKPR